MPRNVVAMGLVSLFNDISSEMIYPIIPIFLKTILGAPVAIIGLIEGVAESTASLFKLFSGWISDKLKKRKIFVTIGYSLSGIAKVLIGLAQSWPFVLFARFIDRFGKGTRVAARDALILESVEPQQRGRAFGLHRSMDSMGAVIGPILALILVDIYSENYRNVFFLAAIPSVIGVLLLILLVKEKKREAVLPAQVPAVLKFKWSDFSPSFKYFLLIMLIFSIGNSSDAFLILRAQNLGLDVTLTVGAYVLYNIAYTIFSYPAGVITDKIGPKKVLAVGLWLFAIVYLLFGFIQSPVFIWILFPLYGIYIGLTDGISRAYMSTMVPTEKSGTAFGAQQMVVGICVLFASIIAGLLWTKVSPSAPFYFGGIMAAIAAVMFTFSTAPKLTNSSSSG